MPGAGLGVALPVIYVPGEHIERFGYLPGGVEITNSWFTGVLITLFFGLLLVSVLARSTEVPGRAQLLLEMIFQFWDDQARNVIGSKGRQLLPFILGLFFFLLAANLIKVVPGVDTFGELHCAGLTPGVKAEDYALGDKDPEYLKAAEEAYIAFSGYNIAGDKHGTLVRLDNDQTLFTGDKMPFKQYKACKERLHPHEGEEHSEAEGEHSDEATSAEGDHSETSEAEGEHSDEAAVAAEGESASGEGEATTADSSTEGEGAEAVVAGQENGDDYPTENKDHGPEYDRYSVTPFFRGPSTDLSLTLAIATLAVLLIQYYGIKELGVAGWGVKFLNLPALEGKDSPIMFAVGLLEIVLEIAKIVSFAFRLFGAMFAGQILMFVIVFLVGMLVPVAIIGLEVFIGAIQAFVFSILFLMFAAGAMTSHHHDDEHHEEAHAQH
jgi:F0F1-type ATP synthase membrane subunit a